MQGDNVKAKNKQTKKTQVFPYWAVEKGIGLYVLHLCVFNTQCTAGFHAQQLNRG